MKKYIIPNLEVSKFEAADVVTTSGGLFEAIGEILKVDADGTNNALKWTNSWEDQRQCLFANEPYDIIRDMK